MSAEKRLIDYINKAFTNELTNKEIWYSILKSEYPDIEFSSIIGIIDFENVNLMHEIRSIIYHTVAFSFLAYFWDYFENTIGKDKYSVNLNNATSSWGAAIFFDNRVEIEFNCRGLFDIVDLTKKKERKGMSYRSFFASTSLELPMEGFSTEILMDVLQEKEKILEDIALNLAKTIPIHIMPKMFFHE